MMRERNKAWAIGSVRFAVYRLQVRGVLNLLAVFGFGPGRDDD